MEEVSSLSAILLDESYYKFLHTGKRDLDGLSVIDPERIIPLKARVWLDLTERNEQRIAVDSSDIRKHKKRRIQAVPDGIAGYPGGSLLNRL